MTGTMPPHPLYALMACTETTVSLTAQFVRLQLCMFKCIFVQPAGVSKGAGGVQTEKVKASGECAEPCCCVPL
jgi:hypothetical protein